MRSYLFTICLLLSTFPGNSQDKIDYRFGNVSAEHFNVTFPGDTSAAAIIVADMGTTDFAADRYNHVFFLEFKHQKRIKIVNRNGFDAATVEIGLYVGDDDKPEELQSLKAYTFNLENGKVVKTALDNKSVYTERRSKNWIIKKFTFPALKEGSLIEYGYTIKSQYYFNLQPWQFQGRYPCLWSEYNTGVPDFFTYLPITQGYQPFHIKSTKTNPVTYTFRTEPRVDPGLDGGRVPAEDFTLTGTFIMQRWVMKNVPGLKIEPHTTSLDNHIAKIEFQLSRIQYPGQIARDFTNNWNKLSKELLDSENFGKQINRGNRWLNDEMEAIVAKAQTKLDKAKAIYNYVSKNFITKGYGFRLVGERNLKDVFKDKSGTVGEVNLMLIAMLKHEQLDVEPVILSTRNNGKVQPLYPMLFKYNYLIASLTIDGNTFYLDASEPKLAFGCLPSGCYNGYATLIAPETKTVVFASDSIVDATLTMTALINSSDKKGLEGSFTSSMGSFGSHEMRNSISTTNPDAALKEWKKSGMGIELTNLKFEGIEDLENPLQVKGDIKIQLDEDVIYFNPIVGSTITENPFTSTARFYPVEMPYRINKTYILNMEIPAGYSLEELPKSARVLFNDNEGMFEYLIGKVSDTNIQLRSKVVLNKATFAPEDYEPLRDFFASIVKKHREQIVFKKNP